MRTIHLLAMPIPMSMPAGIAMTASAAPGKTHSPISIEFHIGEPTASALTLTHALPLEGAHDRVHLHKEAALTLRDIEKAVVTPNPANGKTTVLLFLTPDGAKALELATGGNIGKRLGVVVDEKLILAAEIKQKIAGDKVFLGEEFADKDANELAGRINNAVAKPKGRQ